MEKPKFKTQITAKEVRTHYFAPTGQKTEMRHNPVMKKDGRRVLERTKEVAIYDLIQASREECEIENIIRRAVEGDYNALNAVNGVFADITNCPSSIAEAQQYIINAKQEFDNLPKEIKAKFEYNPEIYVAEMGGNVNSWLEKMGYTEAKAKFDRAQKAKVEMDELTKKALSNLANGTTVTQKGGEVNE